MVHYLYKSPSLIENLTTDTIICYDSGGNFVALKPCLFTKDEFEKVYIVNNQQYKVLRKMGIRKNKLFVVAYSGIGRNGVRVSGMTTKDCGIRLIPWEE